MPVNNPAEPNGADEFSFRAIGVVQSNVKYHYEAPRQAVYAATGAFLLWRDPVYRAAAEDLKGFDRIWLVWVFNLNKHTRWRTHVRVPVPAAGRDSYSVFATRSPYRPNPIGISVVELKEVTSDGLLLGPCDLLDGTMVLDVKPYIPEVDSFPESKAGWRDLIDRSSYHIFWQEKPLQQAEFIAANCALDLQNLAQVQLSVRPKDKTRKRLEFDAVNNEWILHCRTWKLHFICDDDTLTVTVKELSSNYQTADLSENAPDPYGDKALHRDFIRRFKSSKE